MSMHLQVRGVRAWAMLLVLACGRDDATNPPNPPPSNPMIAITVVPGSLSIVQGTVVAAQVNVIRTAFTGPVILSLSGLPVGITSVDATTSTASAMLTFSAAATAAVGASTATITASGTGVSAATAPLAVAVTPIPGTAVTRTFCGSNPDIPIWVAAQTAAGEWQQLTKAPGERYTFGVSGTSGLASVTQSGANYSLSILYGALADFQDLAAPPCADVGTKTVTSSVTGHTTGEAAQVALGPAFISVGAGTTSIVMNNVRGGALDLVALRRLLAMPTPLRMIIRPNVTADNGGIIAPLDFTGSEAFDPEAHVAMVSNPLAGERFTPTEQFRSARGTFMLVGSTVASASTTVPFFAVPAARTSLGDVQSLYVVGTETPVAPSPARLVLVMFRTPQDFPITMGSPLAPVAVSVAAAAPNMRVRIVHNRQPEYDGGITASISQPGRSLFTQHMGPGSSYDYSTPDFSTVAGWNPAFGLQPNAPTFWNVGAYTWSGAPLVGVFPIQKDGIVFRNATRSATLSP